MRRQGLSLSLRTIVIAVVLLLLAVLVLQGFRGNWGDFNIFTQENIQSSDINTCESRVQGFCQQAGSDGKDWAARHPNCEQYSDVIDSGDTTCPLQPESSASVANDERVEGGGGVSDEQDSSEESATERGPTQCESGDWVQGGSESTIDIEVVDAANSILYENRYERAVDGICEGLQQLYEDEDWFDGFRVTLQKTGETYGGDRSGVPDWLDEQGLTQDIHYHVIYESTDGSRSTSTRARWGKPSWSAISTVSTGLHASEMPVRSVHHVIHNYIKGSIARDVSGRADLSGYDAIHALGTYSDDEGVRSVMADRNEYIGKAESGTCSGDDPQWQSTAPKDVEDIYFSTCTKDALERSANDADGVEREETSDSCGPTSPSGSYTCTESADCPAGSMHEPDRDGNCGTGEICCYTPSSP